LADTPQELLERLRADRGPIPDALIEAALDVPEGTAARWERGETPSVPPGAIERLAWLKSQARIWYLRVMPVLLAVWRSGPELEKEWAGPARRPAGDYISEVHCRRVDRDVIEYRINLDADFEFVSFVVFGPDRDRVRIGRTQNVGDELAVRFCAPSYGQSSEETQLLGRGDEVVLYARFVP